MQTSPSIFDRAKVFGLPLGEYALFGSALLDAWGIRPANDLDIVATPELFARLKAEGWAEERLLEGFDFTMLSRGEANVTTVQDRPTHGDYCPDRIALIKDAVIIRGVPFIRIEEVIACKRAYGRPKDFADIASIEAYLAAHAGEDVYAA